MHHALILGFAFWTASALAADGTTSASPPPPGARSFELLDVNRDGQLTFSEAFANPRLGNNFNSLDTNADGFLSRQEVAAIVR